MNQPFPKKTCGSSDLRQSEMFDFEFIEFASSSWLLLAVSEMILELEWVEEIALSLSEISSICGRGFVEERVALEVVLWITGTDSSFEIFEIFENFVCEFNFLLPERESDEATELDLIEFCRFDERVESFEELEWGFEDFDEEFEAFEEEFEVDLVLLIV